ncbi:MAG: NAD(P)-dependent alcohol dehydrogenase [Chloroflexi bacterium]|nr:NAD(P)-dependent alcohol dehydrogenase [Chloroflexota bacterium]
MHEWGKSFQIDDIPIPEVKGEETLIKVIGSYVCTSDRGLIKGRHRSTPLPMIPGHNVTGKIEKMGPFVSGFQKGDMVAVYGAWGCGTCRICRQGDEQLCDSHKWVGFGIDGGYAEYLRVPAQRHLIKIGNLNPYEVAVLLDAGLTAYRPVKQILPLLYPGAFISILGSGNIGYYAIQIAKVLSQGAKVIAVDISTERLELAAKLGADYCIEANNEAAQNIRKITGDEGVQAIIDTVGSTETLKIAAETAGKKAAIILVGLAGGIVPKLPGECSIANSVWGNYNEMKELLVLYANGKIQCQIKCFPLEQINDVFQLMETRQIQEQAVITP